MINNDSNINDSVSILVGLFVLSFLNILLLFRLDEIIRSDIKKDATAIPNANTNNTRTKYTNNEYPKHLNKAPNTYCLYSDCGNELQ